MGFAHPFLRYYTELKQTSQHSLLEWGLAELGKRTDYLAKAHIFYSDAFMYFTPSPPKNKQKKEAGRPIP